jgi:hypothetical protein
MRINRFYFASAFRIELARIAMASPYIFHTREACAATLDSSELQNFT